MMNTRNGFVYMRFDDNGPKLGPITREKPLMPEYFTLLNGSFSYDFGDVVPGLAGHSVAETRLRTIFNF